MDIVQKSVVASIKRSLKATRDCDVDVQVVESSREEFLEATLEGIHGNFALNSQKESGDVTYLYYRCERFRKAQGKSKGNPSECRANACPAYVTFKFEIFSKKGMTGMCFTAYLLLQI